MGVTLTLRSEHARLAISTGSEAQLCVFHHQATVTLMPMRWDITLSHPFYSLITAYHLAVLPADSNKDWAVLDHRPSLTIS